VLALGATGACSLKIADKETSNMKIARLVGFALMAVMALSLAVASAAFAEPLFLPVGATFTGTSGEGKLEAAENTIICTTDKSSGEITTPHLVGGVTVDFTGCKSSKVAGTECTVKSTNTSTEGLILTFTLHGVLGLILPKGTGTGVGLLLLPVANKKFVTIAKNACTEETTVSGNIAGEITPVGVHTTKGTLVFQGKAGVPSIKDFDPSLGGLVKPELEAFGHEASEETTETITWSTAVEVS
jgi:hypothetical protein